MIKKILKFKYKNCTDIYSCREMSHIFSDEESADFPFFFLCKNKYFPFKSRNEIFFQKKNCNCSF